MAVYFLDSSAVVKRFARETGSSWVLRLFRRSSQSSIYISRVTPVETVAGLTKRIRMGLFSEADLERAARRIDKAGDFRFIFVEVNERVMDTAILLVRNRKLRGFDAIQLASALEISRQRSALGAVPVVFVSADRNLNDAALAEGLSVEDPNDH